MAKGQPCNNESQTCPMVESFEFRGLGASVAQKLRDDVLSGRYAAGQRLVEREIAEELGLSRGPIRDALRQLHNEGLVSITPRRGTRVASLSREDTSQTIEIRASLEPLAVKYMLESSPTTEFPELHTCVDRLTEASSRSDWSALVELDMVFHETIFDLSGSLMLRRMWDTMRVPLLQTFRMHRSFYDSGEQVVRSHQELLDELTSGDIERAQAASREHVVDLRDRLLPTIT